MILFYLFIVLCHCNASTKKRPNVIIILADDLGYGDLGWQPFIGDEMKHVKTPNLEKMSKNGITLTNFHTASPVCSPSRASIMVGLFPWRLGVDFIYAGDLKLDGSEELDHEQLPLIPNMVMSFHESGYYTAHIGKWHLGGQSHIDIPNRLLKNNTCATPGILQYGYDEYVGMSEGTGSMRYQTHQNQNTYATGSKYLFRNDIPIPPKPYDEILTNRQTDEAIRVIKEQTEKQSPFFLNLWFDAPHSPWEQIEPYYSNYSGNRFSTDLLRRYASMISNMDENIGRLLDVVDNLGIAADTLIFFTSDNGHEGQAGSSGPYLGLKRLVTEGGIRVPAICQWKGSNHIKPGSFSDKFIMTTDLFPTLLHAAKIRMPSHIRIDGFSFLPVLLNDNDNIVQNGDERTVLWYTHCPGYSKFSAVWSHGIKLIWNDYEGRQARNLPPQYRLFDMKNDPIERKDLLPSVLTHNNGMFCDLHNISTMPSIKWSEIAKLSKKHDSKIVMLLLNYMHIKLHLFRYLGDMEWRLMHKNPVHTIGPTCRTRKSNSDTIHWLNMFLAPEFCGDSVFNEVNNEMLQDNDKTVSTCSCNLNDCVNVWFNKIGNGWSQGVIGPGISTFALSGSPMEKYLLNILKITLFEPLCTSKDTLLSSITSNMKSFDRFLDKLETMEEIYQQHWISGEIHKFYLTNKDHPDMNKKVLKSSHQRLHSRGKHHAYLGGSSCGEFVAMLYLNFPGMSAPLALCSQSYMKYFVASKPRYIVSTGMDDNLFLVSLNVCIRLPLSSALTKLKHEGQEFDVYTSKIFSKSYYVGIVDPLMFHLWQQGPTLNILSEISNINSSASNTAKKDNFKFDESIQYFGFSRHLLNRLNRVDDHALDIVIIPMFHSNSAWTVTMLIGISSLTSPYFLVFYPNQENIQDSDTLSQWKSTVLKNVFLSDSNNANFIDIIVDCSQVNSKIKISNMDSSLAVLIFIGEVIKKFYTEFRSVWERRRVKMKSSYSIKDFNYIWGSASKSLTFSFRNEKITLKKILDAIRRQYETKEILYLIEMSKKKF